jgi:MFS family permease
MLEISGLLVGCIIGGPLGDKIGRKRTLVISCFVVGPSVIISGFVPKYEVSAAEWSLI